ncbi:MAG: 30S ribosomal protein S3 [Clostridia bacterium]|nr:30S ribosomal protein S3 [Clostridia bacterium]
MGQKVNPHGLRVGVNKDWDSRWFVSDEKFGDTLVSDNKIRKFLKNKLQAAGVPKIEIERDSARVIVFIHCARPGMVIGQNGKAIEELKAEVEKMVGEDKAVFIKVVEAKNVDLEAQLVAESIAAKLEGRIAFRRAMRGAITGAMKHGAKGIKVSCGGRLGGAEIARTEHYHEGTIPLQTLRADIDYGFWEANTTYGKIGVKVWIYKGDVLSIGNGAKRTAENAGERKDRRDNRRDNRRGDRRDNRNGERREGGNRGGFRRNDRDAKPMYGTDGRRPKPVAPAAAPKKEG